MSTAKKGVHMDQELKVGARSITVTNPDKLLFKKSKISKKEFVEYYQRIASTILPHIKNRPISMF